MLTLLKKNPPAVILGLGFAGCLYRMNVANRPTVTPDKMPITQTRTRVEELTYGQKIWISPSYVKVDYQKYVWVAGNTIGSQNYHTDPTGNDDKVVRVERLKDGYGLEVPNNYTWASTGVDSWMYEKALKVRVYNRSTPPQD